MQYLWSDAWLLQAIICADLRGEGTLDRILETADVLNQAPINVDELHGGLVRLSQGGLIRESNDRFAPTDKLPGAFRDRSHPRDWSGTKLLSQFLNAEGWEIQKYVRDPRNNLQYPGLTSEKLKAADDLYHKRAAQWMTY